MSSAQPIDFHVPYKTYCDYYFVIIRKGLHEYGQSADWLTPISSILFDYTLKESKQCLMNLISIFYEFC